MLVILCCLLLAACSAINRDELDVLKSLDRLSSNAVIEGSERLLRYYKEHSSSLLFSNLDSLRTINSSSSTHGEQMFSPNRLREVIATTATAKATSSIHIQSTSFTCMALPKEYDPHYFCSGVVDYHFIVPEGITVAMMEEQARGSALYLTSFINAPCLSDMKRLICSSLYQPCVPQVIPDDPTSYMATEAPAVQLPYIRPCGSLCVAVTHYGTTCGSIIEAFGLARDCLAVDPYTGLMTYDFASTPMSAAIQAGQRNPDGSFAVPVCNDLPSSIGVQTVHDPFEPYIGEMCESITHSLYVPPSSALDATLAPFLPPFQMQAQIEGTIAMYEAQSPAFWSADCRLARRQYMCGMYFSTPYPDDSLAMFFGTVYIPSYTHRSVCDHYVDHCPQMLPFMPAYCDLVLPSGAKVFPDGDQAVFNFDLGFGRMALVSPPHYQANVTMTLPSECPYGTVVPENIDLANKNGIPNLGTACALACPVRTLTDDEYSTINLQRRVAYWFSVLVGLLQLLNLSILKRARQNIFVVCAAVGIFTVSLLRLIQIEVGHGESDDSMCSSNASWYTVEDFGESLGNNLCTVVALFSLYQLAFMYWVLVTLSVEIWLRVTRGVKEKDINSWRRYYLTIMGACSAGWAALNTYYGQPDVAGKGIAAFTCGWVPNSADKIFYANTIFEIVCFAVMIVLFGHVIYVCVRTSLSVVDAERKPLRKIWRSYSMIFLFLALHLILYGVTIFYLHVYVYYVNSDATAAREVEWYVCLFENFLRADDTSYLATCGQVPQGRPGIAVYLVEEPIIYFTALVLLYITLYKEVREFWHLQFLRFLAYAGVKFLALQVLGQKQAGGFFTMVRHRATSVFSSSGQSSLASDVEMEEGLSGKVQGKPTPVVAQKPINLFAEIGVPRSDSHLPELKKIGEGPLQLQDVSEGHTAHNSARDSDPERSQHVTDMAAQLFQQASARHLAAGSSRRNGHLNVPHTIASESDAGGDNNNEYSIYDTLPSFNAAAEALVELALGDSLLLRGEEGRARAYEAAPEAGDVETQAGEGRC